jgi:hypothetical protein
MLKLLYKIQHGIFFNLIGVPCNIPSKNTSLKMATIGDQNIYKVTLLGIQKI